VYDREREGESVLNDKKLALFVHRVVSCLCVCVCVCVCVSVRESESVCVR